MTATEKMPGSAEQKSGRWLRCGSESLVAKVRPNQAGKHVVVTWLCWVVASTAVAAICHPPVWSGWVAWMNEISFLETRYAVKSEAAVWRSRRLAEKNICKDVKSKANANSVVVSSNVFSGVVSQGLS
jgi:hypothetical protein